jgi:hypothetical protein
MIPWILYDYRDVNNDALRASQRKGVIPMRTAIMILAVLSILFLVGAGAMGLSIAAKPALKVAHKHMALTGAAISIFTHLLALAFLAKNKKETPST